MNEIEVEQYYNETNWGNTNARPFKDITQAERRALYNSYGIAFWRLNKAGKNFIYAIESFI